MVKNPPANQDTSSIPGLGRSPGEGNGNPLQCSCLERVWSWLLQKGQKRMANQSQSRNGPAGEGERVETPGKGGWRAISAVSSLPRPGPGAWQVFNR